MYIPEVRSSESNAGNVGATTRNRTDASFEDAIAAAREQESGGVESPSETEKSEGEYPLEAYSIPGWFDHDFLDGYADVTTVVGKSYEETLSKYDRLSRSDQILFDEYSGIVHSAFREGLDKIGVSGDTGKYYNEFVKNGENQRAVRESIIEKLESNPRALKLMKYFGINYK